MSAYMIFSREKTLDQGELDLYAKEVKPTLAGHQAKVLAYFGSFEDVEGSPTEGTAILEFPNMAAAKAWYDSPLYRKVREHRFKGAAYHVILVNGI